MPFLIFFQHFFFQTTFVSVFAPFMLRKIFISYFYWVSPASLTLRLRGFNNFNKIYVFYVCFVICLDCVFCLSLFVYLLFSFIFYLRLIYVSLLAIWSCNVTVIIIIITYIMIRVMFIFYALELLL